MNIILILIVVIIIFIIILFIDYNYCIEGFVTYKQQYSIGQDDKSEENNTSQLYREFKSCLDSLGNNDYNEENIVNDAKMKTYFDTETITTSGKKKPIWFKYNNIYYKNPHAKSGVDYLITDKNYFSSDDKHFLKDVYYCGGLETCPNGYFRDEITRDCTECPIDAYCNDNNINYCSPLWDGPSKLVKHDLQYSPKRTYINAQSLAWYPVLNDDDVTKQIKNEETHTANDKAGLIKKGSSLLSDCKCPANYKVDPQNSEQCVLINQCTHPQTYGVGTDGYVRCVCAPGYKNVFDSCIDEKKCPTGTEWSDEDKTCKSCNLGYYKNTNSTDNCKQCPSRSTTNAASSIYVSSCICEEGYHLVQTNPTTWECQQVDCPAGQTGNPGSCSNCPTGTYKTRAGNAVCTNCPAGKFSKISGSKTATDCNQCSANTYSAAGSTDCTDCPANSSSQAGSTLITDCTCNSGFTGSAGGPCTSAPALPAFPALPSLPFPSLPAVPAPAPDPDERPGCSGYSGGPGGC